MTNLWSENHPRNIWHCQPDPPSQAWEEAIRQTIPILDMLKAPEEIDIFLENTLGEGQFGSNHWRLSLPRRLYYHLKPLFPRALIDSVKGLNSKMAQRAFPLSWPIEDRYVRFQWDTLQSLADLLGDSPIRYRDIWPDGHTYAFVLTHDIETEAGLAYAESVAALEVELGFRSSFNLVPERYPIDLGLINRLRARGFEIGIHCLKHDGKLFNSQSTFLERAQKINQYLKIYRAVGFRAPLMHRHPEWMQALEVEYDLSFFDTDPYEPMPGGCMSIWPFFIGHFVELPYTLPQDCTLASVLGETTHRIWLDKLDFIAANQGMALLNTHPDYLLEPKVRKMYVDFLMAIRQKGGYWHALPCVVARWWRKRTSTPPGQETPEMTLGVIRKREVPVSRHAFTA